jgi:hypothetical protein
VLSCGQSSERAIVPPPESHSKESSMPLTDDYIFEVGHVDLYDKTDVIPFDKLDEFFTENLAAPSSDAVGELVGSTS